MNVRLLPGQIVLALLLLVAACATSRPPAVSTPAASADTVQAFRVFLVGGAGNAPGEAEPTLEMLRLQLLAANDRSVVVFLGDNVGAGGMPDSGYAGRARAEAPLLTQINAVRDFPGRVVFIPGDNDWARGREDGFASARREEEFVESVLSSRKDADDIFIPDGGLPGPKAVELSNDVVLIAINTQWWLHPAEKPYGDDGDVDLELDEDFLLELDDLLEEYRDQTVLVVGHHPVASSGPRAGRYPLRSHLFPLTELHPSAYIPLPVVGSLPFLYARYFGGSRQDLAHPRYASLRDHLLRIFDRHERLIYASAHERSLQYLKTNGQVDPRGHLLVSGSASSAAHTAGDGRFDLAEGDRGFMILDFYQEGSVWMEAWTTDDGGRRLYRGLLEGPDSNLRETHASNAPPMLDDGGAMRTIAANPNYAGGSLHEFFFGQQYRREWATPITVPVLDLSREADGLSLLRRGGGVQTASLRFKGGDGIEYVARTVDKDPRRTLPEHLRSALVEKVVLDFNSSLHPYGALMVPRLADALGVYHTNPRLRIIPNDPRLGRHRNEFAGRLVLFEERPDEDLSDLESFGYSENVIGTPKLYEEVDGDNDHRVDQRAFARARLFDMLIADWDRHWDQWRWASFEPADSVGKIYEPVPRDRDWAFARFEGVIPTLVQYAMPKFQGFGDHYRNLKALNHQAMHLDRRFTAELTRSDWLEIADSMRAALTDEVIERAARSVPEPIFALRGEETIRILKSRRDGLTRTADKYYRLSARIVDVIASNKHERFEISDAPNGATRVVVLKTTKNGEVRKTLYERTFLPDETSEIRLYGQNGNDQFDFRGASSPIVVRAIGGAGEDQFTNDGPDERSRTKLYDTSTGNSWAVGRRTIVNRSDDPSVNLYDDGFAFNQILPIAKFGSNNTDGVLVGGGVRIIRHGFRKSPHAHAHKISAAFATASQGVELAYADHFTSTLGTWDTSLDAELRTPNNIRNFYGLGNETPDDARSRVEFGSASLGAFAERRVGSAATFRVGPTFELVRVSAADGTLPEADDTLPVADDTLPEAEGITYGDQWTGGLSAGFLLDGRDEAVNPTQGVRWSTDLTLLAVDAHELYSTARSVFSVYATPRHVPQITLALRAGGSHIVGDFPFYAASTLGGDDNLRGYRSNRFGGRSSLFQNLEARVELFKFSTYVLPGHFGILGFVDNGRVWLDDEPSRQWHQTYGGGLWVRVLDRFIVTGTYGWSDDSSAFVLKTGFQF